MVNQSLCNVGGRFVYKLVVLGPTGEVTNLTVDALPGSSRRTTPMHDREG